MRLTGKLGIFIILVFGILTANNSVAQDSSEYDKVPVENVEKLLELIKFKSFNYSENGVVDAINLLTNKMYWRGIQVTISGKRHNSLEPKKSTSGAIFYVNPMSPPLFYDFFLENVTAKQVMDHISYNCDLEYTVKEGEVAFTDRKLSGMDDEPEDGFATAGIQKIFKERDLKEMKKYMGKTFKVSGILTGIGRGTNSKTTILGIDGGLTRIEVLNEKLDRMMYKRMQKKITDWKKDGGAKKLNEAQIQAARDYVELNLREVGNDLFIVFEAVCAGTDKDRLVFKDPSYIFVESEQKYLYKNEEK